MATERHRVLIVDDSKAMCQFLEKVLSVDDSLLVVGAAQDPYEARDMIKTLRPDVLTLDIEMPRMDGITFLRNLMRLRPMPVVMLSSLTAAGAAVTLEAMEIGAVDFMVKRHPGGAQEFQRYADEIITVVKNAARANVANRTQRQTNLKNYPEFKQWQQKVKRCRRVNARLSKVIAIGASTGGPEALQAVLTQLEKHDCAVIVCQHMPDYFMSAFANRLNTMSQYTFAEATDNQVIEAGRGYVAPGGSHLQFKRLGDSLIASLDGGPKCNGHRPAVDLMFGSLAKTIGNAAVAIQLTGMGTDGAQGMLSLHERGCLTIAQDKRSSAVWGMPGGAVRLGAVDAQLPLQDIGMLASKLIGER
ncbi:MAG: chemotaxis response regulator protein-glutamate methylesterase [Woeseiaceae bacterium]